MGLDNRGSGRRFALLEVVSMYSTCCVCCVGKLCMGLFLGWGSYTLSRCGSSLGTILPWGRCGGIFVGRCFGLRGA